MLFMSLLSPKGKGKEAVDYLKKIKATQDIKVHDIYVTLGRYDGVIVFDAPDPKRAMSFVMEIGFATDYTIETLTALSVKEL
jgi:uncharacterized protein with GYD domain